MKTSTRCVHSGPNGDRYGAISPPIYQTATFAQPNATEFGEYDYTRSGNPTRALLEQQLAELEEGKHACAFASGMAAITAITRLVKSGEEIVTGNDLYGGTVRLFERLRERQGIRIRYVDTSSVDTVRSSLTAQTKLIFIETPSNPFFRISDIRALAQVAHATGALLAVDNSMLSPVLQQPLTLGADIVVHSATKFLCGHSDVMGGAVITRGEELHREIAFTQNAEGAGLSPFDSWLLLRGMKTLALRVERQSETAKGVVGFLQSQQGVKRVYYPGNGGVLSFTTGDPAFSASFVEATRLFDVAVSFGSISSTISLPFQMSHASIPAALKHELAPPPDLVRISIGIEHFDDLIADLDRAFSSATISGAVVYA